MQDTYNLSELSKRKLLCEECESETCAFNPEGICGFPLLYGRAPILSDDGCEDWALSCKRM